jgi:hypothetical protein
MQITTEQDVALAHVKQTDMTALMSGNTFDLDQGPANGATKHAARLVAKGSIATEIAPPKKNAANLMAIHCVKAEIDPAVT